MNERKRSDISIMRDDNIIVTVPITKDCKRVFRLMEEDYIKLSFIHPYPIELHINDYIDDEIFGKFFIASKQAGVWTPNSGVYKYELTFVAEYMMWANFEYMYTSREITKIGTEAGNMIRKESEWYFTANLSRHLDMICQNLVVLGFDYSYAIDNVATAHKVKYQENKPQNILGALNRLAEDYECEWWVERKVIHFGKCEHGEEIVIDPQQHLSSYSIKDNRKEYCNVIRAYGGDKNIPASYRKDLYLTMDYSFEVGGVTYWADLSKKLSPSFFNVYAETNFDLYAHEYFKRAEWSANTEQYACIGLWKSLAKSAEYTITLPSITVGLGFIVNNFQNDHPREAMASLEICIEYDDNTSILLGKWETDWVRQIQAVLDLGQITSDAINKRVFLHRGKRCRISLYIKCYTQLYLNKQERLVCSFDKFPCADGQLKANCVNDKDGGAILDVSYYDNGYVDTQIEIMSLQYQRPDNGEYLLYGLKKIDTETRENVFTRGRVFLVHTDDNVDIPQAYYLDSLSDPSNIARLGSRRLRLPVRDEHNSLTHGVITDKDETIIKDFKNEILIGEVRDNGNHKLYWRPTLLNPLDPTYIHWDEYHQPIYDIDGNPMVNYYCGSIELTDLSVGDEVMFGNYVATGITNMVRWVVLDKDDYVIEYSRGNNTAGESSYIVTEQCKRIICAHYYTEPPYVGIIRTLPTRTKIEKTVIFDDIYPKMLFYVKGIETKERTDKQEFEGEGVSKEWNWLEYTITLQTHDGRQYNDFRFKNRYILQDEKLRLQFLYPDAVKNMVDTGSPCKLSGMTFDVSHKTEGTTSKFTLVRNDEFGAKLPSDILCPSIGDPCTLIGWNIKAVQSSGIIEEAEQQLYDRTMEYKFAMKNNPFTFECTLFADFCINNTAEQYFADSKERVLVCADGKYYIVKNHILLTQGQKITIKDPTLYKGECKSRVIGYEYKLDIPWDNPKITVGETDAYSRLAKIEKLINT